MAKKILILMGHPDTNSFNSALADQYHVAAEEVGHDVRRINISDLQFDPILHKGHKEIQPLEPDLLSAQESIAWCDHLVLFYPNWWSAMPALLKGFFDRIWLNGFAYTSNTIEGKINPMFKGKTARVVMTLGKDSGFKHWWKYGDYTNEIQHSILGFAGFRTTVKVLGQCETVPEVVREHWLKEITDLAKRGI